jgi:molybdenum cofactor cytidylyltransferase
MTNFAVVPAAGKSTRMGRPKLALPLGPHTVLERVVHALHGGGIDHILVVLGPHLAGLATVAQAAGAHVLPLAEETPDMRATVAHGLGWLAEHFRPRDDDAWLLVPADHPTLDAAVVRQLLAAHATAPDKRVVVPTHAGRRGHPTLISWGLVAGLAAFPAGQGLNVYLRQHAADTLEVAVEQPEILFDLDTPADYARLLEANPCPPALPGYDERRPG